MEIEELIESVNDVVSGDSIHDLDSYDRKLEYLKSKLYEKEIKAKSEEQ